MAVTVTYEWPVAGTTPPTAAQVADEVTARVVATADADTTAVITHNMGLTAADLAAGRPTVVLTPLIAAASLSLWTAAYTDGNTITLTKATTAGSGNAGAQLRVDVKRPHTIGR